MQRVGALVAAGLLAACSGQSTSSADPKASSAKAPSSALEEPAKTEAEATPDAGVQAPIAKALSCDERVKNLEAGFARERAAVRVPVGVRPAEVAAWKEIAELGPLIAISGSDEIRFEGERLPRSEIMLRLERLGDDRASVPLLVIADRGAKAGAVYATIKGHPKKLEPQLVVARDTIAELRHSIELPAGAAPWVTEWLAEHRAEQDHGKRARHLRSAITKAAGTGCKELSTAFRTIASAFGRTRQAVATEIPRALTACQCAGVDPGFEMVLILSRFRADSLGQLPLGKKLPSSVKADATVEELARALSASLAGK